MPGVANLFAALARSPFEHSYWPPMVPGVGYLLVLARERKQGGRATDGPQFRSGFPSSRGNPGFWSLGLKYGHTRLDGSAVCLSPTFASLVLDMPTIRWRL
jgi:hypothetical protein